MPLTIVEPQDSVELTKLRQLYEQRAVLDELIRAFEGYETYTSRIPMRAPVVLGRVKQA